MRQAIVRARRRRRPLVAGLVVIVLVAGGLLADGEQSPFEGDERLAVVGRAALPAGPWRIAPYGSGIALVARHPDRLIRARLDGDGHIRLGRPVGLPGPPHDLAVDGDTIWVAIAGKGVFAYNDGRRVWSARLRRGSYRVAVAGGWVWSVDGYGDKLDLLRIDPRTRRVRARTPLRVFAEELAGAPDGTLLALGNGRLQRIRAGRPPSSVLDTGEHWISSGDVAGGRLWFTGSHAVVGLGLRSTASKLRVTLPGEAAAASAGPRGVVVASFPDAVSVIGLDGTMRATARTGELSRVSVAIDRGGTVWATGYDQRRLVALRLRP